jgi:hypothetical protein
MCLALECLGGLPRAQKGEYRARSKAVFRAHFNLLCRRTVRNGGREPATLKLNTSLVQHVFKIKQPRYRSCDVVQLAGGPWGCGGGIAVWVWCGSILVHFRGARPVTVDLFGGGHRLLLTLCGKVRYRSPRPVFSFPTHPQVLRRTP